MIFNSVMHAFCLQWVVKVTYSSLLVQLRRVDIKDEPSHRYWSARMLFSQGMNQAFSYTIPLWSGFVDIFAKISQNILRKQISNWIEGNHRQGEHTYLTEKTGFKSFILSILSQAGRLPLMQGAQSCWQTNTSGRTSHDGLRKCRTGGLPQEFEKVHWVIQDSCMFLFSNIVGPIFSRLLVHTQYRIFLPCSYKSAYWTSLLIKSRSSHADEKKCIVQNKGGKELNRNITHSPSYVWENMIF